MEVFTTVFIFIVSFSMSKKQQVASGGSEYRWAVFARQGILQSQIIV